MLTRRTLLRAALATAGLATVRADEPPAPPAPRVRSVIHIWLWGGPSHLDTFDPKPDAGRDWSGPYSKAIPTSVDGIQLGQMLPRLAQQAHRYALVRGCTHGNNGHETAAYLVQTGRPAGDGLTWPGLGAITARLRGYDAGYRGLLPPYITLTTPQGRFSESGFLGGRYRPFPTGGDPNAAIFAVDGIVTEGLTPERQRSRRELLTRLDTFASSHPDEPVVRELLACRDQAYELILGDAGTAFDLGQEPAALRDRYGRHRLGQSCLLARRLAERGVPWITVNAPGWDTHKRHFTEMGRKLPELDGAVATLLEDLADRGLLDQTLVWVGGEFGRTPKIDWDPPWEGGRGHHGKAFANLLAGGGVRGGQVVGRTDDKGETVIERPVWPWDLTATIAHLLEFPTSASLPTPDGRQLPLLALPTGAFPKGQSGGMLKELL